MKTIFVPKDKCPLEVLAEIGEQTRDAWIFLHNDVVDHLKETAICVTEYNGYTFNIGGRIIRVKDFSPAAKVIEEVTIGEGIYEFKEISENPKRAFLVKMS